MDADRAYFAFPAGRSLLWRLWTAASSLVRSPRMLVLMVSTLDSAAVASSLRSPTIVA